MIEYHITTELDPQVRLWVGKVRTSVGVAHRTTWCDTEEQAQERAQAWLDRRTQEETGRQEHLTSWLRFANSDGASWLTKH